MTINWGILATFISVGLVALFVIVFLLLNIVPRPPLKEKNTKKILITNDTDFPTNISVDERTFTVPPNQSVQMVIGYGTEVGSPIGNYQIKKGGADQIIVGSYGLHSNLNATPNTRIINSSDTDIQLFYTTDNGSKSIVVPSGSRVRGPTIFKGQRWNVSGTDVGIVISAIPKRIIVWNGKELK